MLLVRRDEHDRRRFLEAAEHLGELQAAESGHLDVEEDRVDIALAEDPQALRRGDRGDDLADPFVGGEQVAELVERRLLVVDQQHAEPRPWGGHTLTPGANFGTRTITLVPAPGAVSTTRP